MGSGSSRMGSRPTRRVGTQQRRRSTIKRTISSILVCGASSSSSSREREDHPAALSINSTEHSRGRKLSFLRMDSDLSLGSGADLVGIATENGVSSGRCTIDRVSDVQGDKGKSLSKSRELVPSHQIIADCKGNETASTSYADESSSPVNEVANMNASNDITVNTTGDTSQFGEVLSHSDLHSSHGVREPLLDDDSVENIVSETIDFSNSHFGSSIPDSLLDFHSSRDETFQHAIPPGLGLLASDREQNRRDTNQLQVDVVGISSNILSNNPAELSSRESRRNSRRLFWDAFSRRSSRRHTDSRTFVFSPDRYDQLRSHDRWLLDFSGDFFSDEAADDFRSHRSRTQESNELQRNSRSEIWERLNGGVNSSERRAAACPRGIHAEGSCFCQSTLSAEDSGARHGISRIVMLAEALFEVLDQIHRQPMSLSLSMVSLPAPESVVNSLPVRTHRKTERLKRADDALQCPICLAEYEEGDKIRVLPCQHEYHVSCVDKWVKEIHGVCPLCRRDVRDGFTEVSASD